MSNIEKRSFIVAIFILTILLSACSSNSDQQTKDQTNSNISRCVQASSIQLQNINAGIKGVDSNNSIKDAWAVKSNDFSNVWMVAAYIYGPGMEDGAGPGIWAMNGDPNQQGITMSVDGFAKSFSDWPDASETTAAITSSDDGVSEAKICAQENKP